MCFNNSLRAGVSKLPGDMHAQLSYFNIPASPALAFVQVKELQKDVTFRESSNQ